MDQAGINGGNLGAGDWFQATQDPFGYLKFHLARCQIETKITKESSKNTWSLAAVHKFAYTNKSKCVPKCVFVAIWLNCHRVFCSICWVNSFRMVILSRGALVLPILATKEAVKRIEQRFKFHNCCPKSISKSAI